jgi:hypothetical protein
MLANQKENPGEDMKEQRITLPVNMRSVIAVVSVCFAILMQTGAIVWGASKIDSRVENVERWIITNADTQVEMAKLMMITDQNSREIDRLNDEIGRTRAK